MTELMEVGTGEAPDAETAGALDAPAPTSWTFQDLGDVLDGKAKRTEATMFRRSDGVPLIYPGKTHAFVGESESMKSWAALAACAERLMLGEVVLYVDFEDTKFTFVERLLDLGVPKDVIRDKAAYIRPSEPLKGDREKNDLRTVRDRYATPVLVILDGVTECMTLHGWDPNVGTDVVKFLEVYPRYMPRQAQPSCSSITLPRRATAAVVTPSAQCTSSTASMGPRTRSRGSSRSAVG